MNITSYKKITSELRKKYHFPKEIPKKKEDNAGWFGYGNQRLIEKYLYCNDNLIIEFGSYLGKSARYLCEKSSPYATVICVDSWDDGGTSIQNGIKKKNNNNAKVHKNRLKHLYETFLVNMWEYKDKIIPIKMDGRKAAKMLSDMEVRPNFIYLDMDHTYDSVKGDLKALHDSFPNTLIIGDDIKYHKGVGKAVKEFIDEHKQYKLEIDENAFVLIPNIQKYEQDHNLGLRFRMISPNKDELDEKLAIIVPMVCSSKEKKCDVYKMIREHYKKMEEPLKCLERDYHVFYISQIQDGRPMNKGKLLNVGYQIAKKNGCDIFIFQTMNVAPNKNIMSYYDSYPDNPVCLEAKREGYHYQNYYLGTMMFSKDDFKKCNGYPNDIWGEKLGHDYALWLRMATNNMVLDQPISGSFKNVKSLPNISWETFS